jgi:hypothetical protein
MEIRRGVVQAYDVVTHKADVQMIGSMPTLVRSVPCAQNLGGELLSTGTMCAVLFFHGDPGVVLATWDGLVEEWVTSDLVKDAAVTFAKLGESAKGQVVADAASTGVSTSSTSFVQLTGSSLTVTIPDGQTADVLLLAIMASRVDTAGGRTRMHIRCQTDAVVGSDYYATSSIADDYFTLVALWSRAGETGSKDYRIKWRTDVAGHTSYSWNGLLIAVVIPT